MASSPETLSPKELELLESAIEKQRDGRSISVREDRAVRKAARIREAERRDEVLSSVPLGVYDAMAGISARRRHDDARAYGAPLRGTSIDLRELVRWMHEFIAENRGHLRRDDDEALMLADTSDPSLSRYRLAKARLAENELAQQTRELVPVSLVAPVFDALADAMREAAEQVGRDLGPAAQDAVSERIEAVLDEAERRLERVAGTDAEQRGEEA